MSKLELLLNGEEVSELSSLIRNVFQHLSPAHALDVTISTVSSHHSDVSVFVLLSHLDVLLFETNHTWVVFIENGDASAGVVTVKSLLGLRADLNEEILIRFPNVIIMDLDLDNLLLLVFLHRDHLMESCVVLGGFGCIVKGANQEDHLL